jgi:hypothetical protein
MNVSLSSELELEREVGLEVGAGSDPEAGTGTGDTGTETGDTALEPGTGAGTGSVSGNDEREDNDVSDDEEDVLATVTVTAAFVFDLVSGGVMATRMIGRQGMYSFVVDVKKKVEVAYRQQHSRLEGNRKTGQRCGDSGKRTLGYLG